MDLQSKSLRVGAAVIACAVLLRLGSNGLFDKAVQAFSDPETAALLFYLETGKVMRPAPATQTPTTQPETTPATEQTTAPTQPQQDQPQQAAAVFAEADVDLVEVNSACGYDADLPALLQQPLVWQLKQDAPTVLILHTHGTESYTKTEDYTESTAYRTLDEGYNVVSVGDRIARVLEAGGVKVIHDRTLHDHPSYSGSYNHARAAIESYISENPSIQVVLDIHRDSVEDSSGKQMVFTTQVQGQSAARLMMVVGTDASGLAHPNWPENMAFGVKLHARLEQLAPGICRPISFRSQRFNQDLSPGALIVEVGSAGNTRQEALLAAEVLAQALLDMSAGATADSTS